MAKSKFKILIKKFIPTNGNIVCVMAMYDNFWRVCQYYKPDEFQLGCSHEYKQGFIFTQYGNLISAQVPKGVKQIRIIQYGSKLIYPPK